MLIFLVMLIFTEPDGVLTALSRNDDLPLFQSCRYRIGRFVDPTFMLAVMKTLELCCQT
jgi:hypothetical protein